MNRSISFFPHPFSLSTGISGLGAAYALSKGHEVELFERDDRAGGHSNTVEHVAAGRTLRLDTGFIARFNERRAATKEAFSQIESDLAAIAAALSYVLRQQQNSTRLDIPAPKSRWKMAGRQAGLRSQAASTSSKWRKT